MDSREFFNVYVVQKWKSDHAYDLAYFKTAFNFDHNITQYHLNRLMRDGKLICLKVRNKSYYMLPKWFDTFDHFTGVLPYVRWLK